MGIKLQVILLFLLTHANFHFPFPEVCALSYFAEQLLDSGSIHSQGFSNFVNYG